LTCAFVLAGTDVKEIKKHVKYLLQNLQDAMNTLVFTQDSYKDGCWLINPDLKKIGEVCHCRVNSGAARTDTCQQGDSSNPLMTTETLTGPFSDGDYSIRKYFAPALCKSGH